MILNELLKQKKIILEPELTKNIFEFGFRHFDDDSIKGKIKKLINYIKRKKVIKINQNLMNDIHINLQYYEVVAYTIMDYVIKILLIDEQKYQELIIIKTPIMNKTFSEIIIPDEKKDYIKAYPNFMIIQILKKYQTIIDEQKYKEYELYKTAQQI